MKSRMILSALALATIVGMVAVASQDETGNGAPSGGHFNLNLIGVPKDKAADDGDTNGNGHRIFVALEGNTKIMLTQGDYAVLDYDGTDGTAKFQLPNPDEDGDGTTSYSVFCRVVGKPGGDGSIVTEATGPGLDGILGTADDEVVSSLAVLELERTKSPKFENVSRYLLYIYADIDLDGDVERVPLFDSRLEDYLWSYDNNGLKVVQLRFYDVSTTVPATYPF